MKFITDIGIKTLSAGNNFTAPLLDGTCVCTYETQVIFSFANIDVAHFSHYKK
jgi:hypothetical protein